MSKHGRVYVAEAVVLLRSVGLNPEVSRTGKGHFRVRWTVGGQPRMTIVGSSISCRHATKNNAANIRRILRADGLLGA